MSSQLKKLFIIDTLDTLHGSGADRNPLIISVKKMFFYEEGRHLNFEDKFTVG